MELFSVLLFGTLLALAALVPAIAMKNHLTHRLVDLRDYYRKMFGRLENESLDARFTVDRDGRVRTFNHRAEQMFGYHSTEIIGKTVDKVIQVDKNVLPSGAIDSLYKNKRSADRQALEVFGRRREGDYFPMELHISETGGYLSRKFYLTARELTERERAEEASRELKFLAASLHMAAAPILIVDGDGIIRRHSAAFERITGFNADEIQNRPYWEMLLAADEWPRAKAGLKTLIARAGSSNDREQWQFKSGERRDFYVSRAGVPLNEVQGGETDAVPAVAVMAAFQIPETAAEVTPGRSLEDTAAAAHEFAGALATIAGKCDMLLHLLGEGDPSRRDVEEIRKAGERAAGLGSHLLSSRNGDAPAFEVEDVLGDLRPMLSSLLGDRIQLAIDAGAGNTRAGVDRRIVEHVILNLALNARDAMPEGGKLAVAASSLWMDSATAHRTARLPEGRYAVVAITDSSNGANLIQRAKALDPVLGHVHKNGGASLSSLIASLREQGGNAVMQAVPGSGTTIRIYLPSAEPQQLFLVKAAAS